MRSLDENNEQNQKEPYARQHTHRTGSSQDAGCGHQPEGQVLPKPTIRNRLQDRGDNGGQEEGLRPDYAASKAHNNRQDWLEEGTPAYVSLISGNLPKHNKGLEGRPDNLEADRQQQGQGQAHD